MKDTELAKEQWARLKALSWPLGKNCPWLIKYVTGQSWVVEEQNFPEEVKYLRDQ